MELAMEKCHHGQLLGGVPAWLVVVGVSPWAVVGGVPAWLVVIGCGLVKVKLAVRLALERFHHSLLG
ncbi:hypothetical protein V6N13_063900 [Hibiscus sabdariffa]